MRITDGLGLAFLLSSFVVGCADADPQLPGSFETGERRPHVIDGVLSPDELDFPVNRFEQNAVVAPMGLGCTGTLVGDRVVVTAAHCVILNFDDWASGSAEPEVVAPDRQTYAIGADASAPICLLGAASVHVHPDIEIRMSEQLIIHDFAVVILEDSVMDRCTEIVPLQPNLEPLSDELIGEHLLQGGFGSLDGTYAFSSQRYWSLLEVDEIADDYVKTIDLDRGFPTYGDSGAGVFRRGADGSLSHLGVCSSGSELIGEMNFVRLDNQLAFWNEVVSDERMLCGSIDEAGLCIDEVAVRCDASGFYSTDCRENLSRCGEDAAGHAACVCDCDTQPYCQSECACDGQCPCECDQTDGCDADCECDGACYPNDLSGDGAEDDGGGCSLAPGRAAPPKLAWGLLCSAILLAVGRRRRD